MDSRVIWDVGHSDLLEVDGEGENGVEDGLQISGLDY